jgi:PAS domain S-box-containing protein
MTEEFNSDQWREANERLSQEVAAHEATLRELQAVRRELELRVAERTKELSIVKQRFETALRGARVHVFTQDRDLRYTWVYAPEGEAATSDLLGKTDQEVLPASERDTIIHLKRKVLQTGEPGHSEVLYILPEGRRLAALYVDPSYAPDGSIDGLICAAIDISRTRSLESEQRRLAEELAAALQRYDTALRGSNVTVFTQDNRLRYTSISNAFLGRRIDEIVGRTDEQILPPANLEAVVALKRQSLESGQPGGSEVHIRDGAADRWFDLHVEPLRDLKGEILGLTCAAVDITERKQGEAHLRMLMRELTHRSKNLLAVIQAMARQTARHAGSTTQFLERFSARLQALAASHDLLVQEGWHGASLHELVRSQLGHYLDREEPPVSFAGPAILLKPEAAQSLGLGLHELATNAAKYGALSTPLGRVDVAWRRLPAGEGNGIEIVWRETGGPPVSEPSRRGFGTTVIERHVAKSLDADVALTFDPQGLVCRINVPVTQFVADR